MIAVVYIPSEADPLSGRIDHQISGKMLKPHDIVFPYVEVFEERDDWDSTHEIVNLQVALRDPEAVLEEEKVFARCRLRVRRDALLADYVDRINPVWLASLTDEQRAEVATFRQTLLDWPSTETDVLNPTEPQAPAFLRKGDQ